MRASLGLLGSLMMVGLAFGCSSSSSGGGGSDSGADSGPAAPVTADQACTDGIGALCDEIQKCAPFLFDYVYGDSATCKSRVGIGCKESFTTTGNGSTPDQLDACAKQVPGITCDAFLGGIGGAGLRSSLSTAPACAPVAGSLADGTACNGDGQCKSAFCASDGTTFCGTCATPPKSGEACINASCGVGLVCAGAKCVAPASAGATCDASTPCRYPLQCFNGKCTAGGKEGDACDLSTPPTAPNCDGNGGVGCKIDLASGKLTGVCQKLTESKVGEPCSFIDLKVCVGGAWCKGYDIKKPTVPGTCAAPADDGAACDAAAGPTCKPSAKCIGGICKISDPTSCK